MRSITTALVGCLVLVAGVGATTFSLPSIAIAPAGMGDTDLSVNDGSGVVAINVNIQYQNAVATPGTPVVGSAAPGFILEWNDLEVDASTRELRIVVYQNPTTEFNPGNGAIVSVPWTAVGAEGTSTPLSFSGSEGASDPDGQSIAANFVGGAISILTPVLPVDETPGAEDLSQWVSFLLLPYPINEPRDPPNNMPLISGEGTTNLGVETTSDNLNDGVAGFASPADAWPWTANSVYRLDWTAQSTLASGVTRLTQARFRARDNADNAFVEMVIDNSEFAGLATDGSARTFSVMFEPSDLTSNSGLLGDVGALTDQPMDGLRMDFDIVDLTDNTTASTLVVTGVDVQRYDRSAVDALFAQEFAVTDFTDPSQWDAALFPNLDADPELEIVLTPDQWPGPPPADVEINFLTTYTENPTFVQMGTRLDSNNPPSLGAPSVGEFGDAAIPGDRVAVTDGTIYREVMSIERLNTAGDPAPEADTAAEIKLRITDQTFGLSVSAFVEPLENRASRTNNNAAGVNRPVPGSSTDYRSYLVYPDHANIQALQDTASSGVVAFLSMIDFNPVANVGDIALNAAAVESTPANALIP